MHDSSTDPVIDDGHRRAVGAPPDVPALPTRLTRSTASGIPSSGRVWDSSRTSNLPLLSPTPADWVCWEHRPILPAAWR